MTLVDPTLKPEAATSDAALPDALLLDDAAQQPLFGTDASSRTSVLTEPSPILAEAVVTEPVITEPVIATQYVAEPVTDVQRVAPDAQQSALMRDLLTSADPARKRTDLIMRGLVFAAFALAMLPLISLLYTVIREGIIRLDPYFLSVTMRGVFGGMDAGGVFHAIVGTLVITLTATLISVPIGLLTAIYLVEYGKGPLARAATFFVDVMTGIPSIVAGLFAFSLFAIFLGPGARLGIAAAVALSVLMIPVVVRSCEEMLRLVPNELREASYALGVPKWLTIVKVVLRTSVAGLTTGILLAIARVIGETAPILITAGFADSVNWNPFSGRMMTLPVYIYTQYRQGLMPCVPGAEDCIADINFLRAWAAALILMVIVMLLNLVGRLITRWFAPKIR